MATELWETLNMISFNGQLPIPETIYHRWREAEGLCQLKGLPVANNKRHTVCFARFAGSQGSGITPGENIY